MRWPKRAIKPSTSTMPDVKDEAVQQLKEKSSEISSRSQALGFSDIAAEAQGALQQDANTFAAPEPMTPAEKKLLRSESYKVRKQQKDY